MFNLFKKQPKKEDRKPRSVIPTYVTDKAIILCKNSPTIRNSYEIRLMLFMAIKNGKPFVLGVSPGARVAEDLQAHIANNGGTIQETKISEYSIYIGHQNPQGSEEDGWVFGDSNDWNSFIASLNSQWIKEQLAVGSSFAGETLTRLQNELEKESILKTNIDEENVKEALLALIIAAKQSRGEVFIQ